MTDFIPPKSPGLKKKIRNICAYKEHDWDGQYYDGWLFLDCTKCEAKNIQHRLTERQVRGMIYGGYNMDVNKLPIRVDKRGNQVTKGGYLTYGYWDAPVPRNAVYAYSKEELERIQILDGIK